MTTCTGALGVAALIGLLVISGATTLERGGQSENPAGSRVERSPSGVKVDINTASPAELERLPGMTRELSQRIIAHRPYRKIDDLVRRKILGRKQLAGIKEHISVGAWRGRAEKGASRPVSGSSLSPR